MAATENRPATRSVPRVLELGSGVSAAYAAKLPWNNTATTAARLATSEFPGRHGRTVIQWAEGSWAMTAPT